MGLMNRRGLTLFIIWIVTVPLSLYTAWTYFPSRSFDWVNIAFFFIIVVGTMLLPIKIKNVNISLEKWLTFTIFLQYGVFAELVFMQIALLILIIGTKSTNLFFHRIFVNSAMFAVVSIVSGGIYHLAGGEIAPRNLSSILFYFILYAASYVVLNNLLLKAYFHTLDRKYSLLKTDALWDYIMTIIMLPFSISLYILYGLIGNKAMVLIGIPIVLILFVLRKYTRSNRLNDQLTSASDIGHELAEKLSFDDVMKTFITKLESVVPYESAYIIDYRVEGFLAPLMGIEKGQLTKRAGNIVFNAQNKFETALDFDQTRIYYNAKGLKRLAGIEFLTPIQSVLTVPIKRIDKTQGFLILTSSLRNHFRSSDKQIIEILANYLSISLRKAQYYEQTVEKNERCALTKLHNFRYLDKKLADEIVRYHTQDITALSVIIVDIDYFKKINDTYGHESGNTILVDLAQILQEFKKTGDTLVRYGGEEFVLLLPNETKAEAIERAEAIRIEIEHTLFTIIPDLSSDNMPIDVHITVSLGVATIPGDAEDAETLMRNADRALYIGGKRAGRNRVGVYGEESIVEMK